MKRSVFIAGLAALVLGNRSFRHRSEGFCNTGATDDFGDGSED